MNNKLQQEITKFENEMDYGKQIIKEALVNLGQNDPKGATILSKRVRKLIVPTIVKARNGVITYIKKTH